MAEWRNERRAGVQFTDINADGRTLEQHKITTHQCRNAAGRIELPIFFRFLYFRIAIDKPKRLNRICLGQ